MKHEMTAKRVAYNWFVQQAKNGSPVLKDVFLYDRTLWDSMSRDLVAAGENPNHDDIKELVRRIDKAGYLGGINAGRSFDDQHGEVEAKRLNMKETGHGLGAAGIRADVTKYGEKLADAKLAEYYEEPGWQKRSREYRESKNWTCELCLAVHRPGKTLVTHHRSYKRADGTSAIRRETDRELMAVCADTCHQLADIARYLRVGRIDSDSVAVAMEPLFHQVR